MMASINGCPPYADHYALACNMIAVAGANAATLRGLTFTQFDVAAQETSLTLGNWKYNSGDLKNLTCTDGTNYYSIWQCYPEGLLTYDLYVFRYEYVFDQQSGTWFWQYQGYQLVYADATDSYVLARAMRGRYYMYKNVPPGRIRLDDGTVLQLPDNYYPIAVEYRSDLGWVFIPDVKRGNDQWYLFTTLYGEITQSKTVQYRGQQLTLPDNHPRGVFSLGSYLCCITQGYDYHKLLEVVGSYAFDVGFFFDTSQFDPEWIMVGDTALSYQVGGTNVATRTSTTEVYALQHVFRGLILNACTEPYRNDPHYDFDGWRDKESWGLQPDGYWIESLQVGDVPCSFMRLILHNASWTFHQPMMQCIAANYNGAAQRGYWYGTAVDQTGTPYRHVVLSAYVNGIKGIHNPFNAEFAAYSFNESGGRRQQVGFFAPSSVMYPPDDFFADNIPFLYMRMPAMTNAQAIRGTSIHTAYDTQLSLLIAMLVNMGINLREYKSLWTADDLRTRLLPYPLEAVYNGLGELSFIQHTAFMRMFTKVDYQNKFIREITL